MSAPVEVVRLSRDFERWHELLAMVRASFAYMDGVIDPPSSVHRLSPALLRAKAEVEVGLVALAGDGNYASRFVEGSEPTGEIVGCAFLAERGDHFYLGKLAVAPAWQGNGVGALLVRAAEEHALRSGKPVIELQTRVELTGNQRMFAKLGFAETGRSAHAGFERPTSITMRKEVA